MRNLLLVVSLGLVAAGVYVFMNMGDPAREGAAAQVEARAVAPAPAAPTADLLELDESDSESSRSSNTMREVFPGGPQGFVEAAAERPGASVHGVIVDEFGNPVREARVLATAKGFYPVDIEEPPADMKRVETLTDARGRFVIEGVAPKSLRLAVRAPGYAPLNRDKLGLPDEDEVELEPLVLLRGTILSGRVVDAEGVAVIGAKLIGSQSSETPFFFGAIQREPAAVTDQYGNFRVDQLAAGPWNVRVEHPAHPSKSFEGVAPEPGAEVGALEFRLDRGTFIRGRVLGLPSGVQARVAASPSKEEFWMGSPRYGAVEASGDFEVSGLQVGDDYSLRLQADDSSRSFFGREQLSTAVRANAGDTAVLLEYYQGSVLTLRVVDAKTGAPIESLSVDAGVNWTRPLMDDDDNKRRREFPDGVVRIPELRLVDADDRAVVEIESPGYEPYELKDLRLASGEELDLGDVQLEPVPVYAVTVLDAGTRAPIPSAWVTASLDASASDGGDSNTRSISIRMGDSDDSHDDHDDIVRQMSGGDETSGRTGAEGTATLNALGVELVSFSATADGYARATLDGITEDGSGITTVTLLLSKGGSVLVKVLEADGASAAGRSVEHRDTGSGDRLMMLGGGMDSGERTNSQGEALFENLEVGSHNFRIAKSGQSGGGFMGADMVVFAGMDAGEDDDWTSVEVVEGETAEIVLTAPWTGTLVGKVTEAGVALAGASLSLKEGSSGESGPSLGFPGLDFGGGARTRSGGGGSFLLEDVEEGTYTLTVSHATRRMPMSFPVEVRGGENVFDVDLPVSILEGRVTDESGQPVAGASVSAQRATSGAGPQAFGRMVFMSSSGGGAVSMGGPDMGAEASKTDADGRYRLRGVLPDTEIQVRVEGGTFQPTTSDSVEVAPNETREGLDIEVAPGGLIALEVFAADGEPAGMCFVSAIPQDGVEADPVNQMIEGGSGELKGLQPGPWKVSLQRIGSSPGAEGQSPEPQMVEVVASETVSIRFDLP